MLAMLGVFDVFDRFSGSLRVIAERLPSAPRLLTDTQTSTPANVSFIK